MFGLLLAVAISGSTFCLILASLRNGNASADAAITTNCTKIPTQVNIFSVVRFMIVPPSNQFLTHNYTFFMLHKAKEL